MVNLTLHTHTHRRHGGEGGSDGKFVDFPRPPRQSLIKGRVLNVIVRNEGKRVHATSGDKFLEVYNKERKKER